MDIEYFEKMMQKMYEAKAVKDGLGNVKKSTVGKSPKTVRCGKTIHSERSGA